MLLGCEVEIETQIVGPREGEGTKVSRVHGVCQVCYEPF